MPLQALLTRATKQNLKYPHSQLISWYIQFTEPISAAYDVRVWEKDFCRLCPAVLKAEALDPT